MFSSRMLLSLVSSALSVRALGTESSIAVGLTPSENASSPIPEAFVSYSIEFAFFPDYAGNSSNPNTFSNNLLDNIGSLTGTKPYIRVGGNTQDFALYNASLKVATNGTYTHYSSDFPTILYIGPSYFESYSTWPNTKFIHGFNLAKSNTAAGITSLLATVPLACRALEGGKLAYWELGNEPDLFKNGIVRPSQWNETDYVGEWLNVTRAIKKTMATVCPNLVTGNAYEYIAPSFAGTSNALKPITTWQQGLDADKDIALISSHNYIGGAKQPGVTLQGTLMNHTKTVLSVSYQLAERDALASYGIPFILGETNSLYQEGAPGLSNTFGAGLWGVDFNLWCASQGIRRVHMHQGTDYRYASWQPVQTNKTSIGTKAPYYGNIAVAHMLGNLLEGSVQIENIPLLNDEESAYAAYVDGRLKRIMVVNMQGYNYSTTVTRPSANYSFRLEEHAGGKVGVQRLMANGSDAVTGITFDGYSYNYELDNGKPVLLANVTRGERLTVGKDGLVTVSVPDSSAAILNI